MESFLELLHIKQVTNVIAGNFEVLITAGFIVFMFGCRIITGHWLPASNRKAPMAICQECGTASQGIFCDKCGEGL